MSKFKSKSNETRVRSDFQTVQFTPGSYHFESAEERRLFLILSIVWSWDCWVHVLLTDTRHAVKSHIIILLRWGIGIFLHIVNLYVHYICVKWRECCLILTKRRHGMFDRLIYKSTIIAEKSLLSCIFAKKIHLRPQQIRLLMDSPVCFFPSLLSHPILFKSLFTFFRRSILSKSCLFEPANQAISFFAV